MKKFIVPLCLLISIIGVSHAAESLFWEVEKEKPQDLVKYLTDSGFPFTEGSKKEETITNTYYSFDPNEKVIIESFKAFFGKNHEFYMRCWQPTKIGEKILKHPHKICGVLVGGNYRYGKHELRVSDRFDQWFDQIKELVEKEEKNKASK